MIRTDNLKNISIYFHEFLATTFISSSKPDLASTGGQILLFFGAVIIIDLFLTVFAFGYLSEETKKKYRRQGILSPFSQRLRPSPVLKKLFRRRPSKLALTLRRKLQQLGPNRHAKRHFGKRDVESEIEREDIFRPTIDYEFNDDQVQQRFAQYPSFWHVYEKR